jgi:hypothetical protein
MASAAMAVLDSIRREHEHRRMWESEEVAIHQFRDDIWILTQGEARRIGEHVWLGNLQQMYGNNLRVVLEEKSDACVQFVRCQLRIERDRAEAGRGDTARQCSTLGPPLLGKCASYRGVRCS